MSAPPPDHEAAEPHPHGDDARSAVHDPHPSRPAFGEYATPREQAALTGRPRERPHRPRPPRRVVRGSGPMWDRALTVALFAAGLWFVGGFVLDPFRFARELESTARASGFRGDVVDGTVDALGHLVAGGLIVIYVVALLTVLLVRRRIRLLFWIPLVGAALSVLLLIVALAIAMAHVPGLLEQLGSR